MALSSSAISTVPPAMDAFLSLLCLALLRLVRRRRHHANPGPLRGRLASEAAAVVADDLGDQRQPETRALALGGHEGVEEMGLSASATPGPVSSTSIISG